MASEPSGLPTPSTSRLPVIAAYGACALIWGTTWFAIRVCIAPGAFATYPGAAWRFSISASILMALCFLWRSKIAKFDKGQATWIAVAGMVSGLGYGLLYAAEEHLTGGLAAVLSATSPLLVAILALRARIESSSRSAIAGSLVAFIGVALVFHDRMQVSWAQAGAVGLMMVVSCLNACSNVMMKKHGYKVHVLASNAVFFTAAAGLLWIASVATRAPLVPTAPAVLPIAALAYLSVAGTVLAFACFFYLLKRVKLSTAMTLAFVTPVIALIVDAFFEKHFSLSVESYLGIGVILCGVTVTVLAPAQVRSTAAPDNEPEKLS